MSNLNMPKFDFSGATVVTADALAELNGGTARTESKYFKPGRHEVKVVSVEYKGQANDATWSKLRVVLEGAGGKQISDLLLVPTRDVTYTKPGGKPTVLLFKNLQEFMTAVGIELTPENMGTVIPANFSNDKALIGRNLVVELGYEKAHLKFSRTATDESICKIISADKTVLRDAGGNELQFSDRASAEAYMDAQGIAYDKFIQVLSYDVSSTPNKTGLNAAW